LSGLFQGDLDNAGNELLDWQYRYAWTTSAMCGFPIFACSARGEGAHWMATTEEGPEHADFHSMWLKAFRMADWMRYTGTSVYHTDRDCTTAWETGTGLISAPR